MGLIIFTASKIDRVIILIIPFIFFLSSCHNQKDRIHVHCLSYNGALEVFASKTRDPNDKIGNLIFHINGETVQADTTDVAYINTAPDWYEDAEQIFSEPKGIYLILMRDGMHGIATQWKDSQGKEIKPIDTPVLCFKSIL